MRACAGTRSRCRALLKQSPEGFYISERGHAAAIPQNTGITILAFKFPAHQHGPVPTRMEDVTLSMGKQEGIYVVCSSWHPSARKCMIAPSAHAAEAYNGQALLLMLYILMIHVQPWGARRAERAAGAILASRVATGQS